jgi:hypothetical protein
VVGWPAVPNIFQLRWLKDIYRQPFHVDGERDQEDDAVKEESVGPTGLDHVLDENSLTLRRKEARWTLVKGDDS